MMDLLHVLRDENHALPRYVVRQFKIRMVYENGDYNIISDADTITAHVKRRLCFFIARIVGQILFEVPDLELEIDRHRELEEYLISLIIFYNIPLDDDTPPHNIPLNKTQCS